MISRSIHAFTLSLFPLLLSPLAGCGSDDTAGSDAGATAGGGGEGGQAGSQAGGGQTAAGQGGGGTSGAGQGGTGGSATTTGGAGGVAGKGGAGGSAAGASGSGGVPIGPAPVLLGKAGNFVILAETGISNVPTSVVTGDLGVSPVAASYITGFSLTKVGAYWTTPQVTGSVFAADNDPPTPDNLTTAITDMMTAYTDAAGRPTPKFLNLGGGALGGLTLTPGLYTWSTAVTIPSDVTIAGGPDDTWIFQITGDLVTSAATKVTLSGGARARNVVWQVAGTVDFGATSHFEGVVLCQTAIKLGTGASIDGRLLAQTMVALDASTVTAPSPLSSGPSVPGEPGVLARPGRGRGRQQALSPLNLRACRPKPS